MSRLRKKANHEWLLEREAGGGINQNARPYEVPDAECVELVNAVFYPGLWQKRKGYEKKLRIKEAAGYPIDGMFTTNYDAVADRLLVVTGGVIYAVNTDTWAYRALTMPETMTTENRVDFCMAGGVVFFTNGVERVMKWRGGSADVEYVGIEWPDTFDSDDFTISYLTSGNLDEKNYSIALTLYNENSGIESDYVIAGNADLGDIARKAVKVTFNWTAEQLSNIETQATHVRCYLTAPAETTDAIDTTAYYLVDNETIENVKSNYYVEIGKTWLFGTNAITSQTAMPTVVQNGYCGVPPKCRYIETAKNRLFYGYIYYDDEWHKDEYAYGEIVGLANAYYDYTPAINYKIVPTRGGDITRLVAWGDYIYIFHENGLVVETDPSAPDMSVMQEMTGVHGCISPWSMSLGHFQKPVPAPPELKTEEFELVEGLIYLSKWGFVGFDGQREYILSEKVENLVNDMSQTEEDDGVGLFSDGKYYYSYSKAKSGNRIIVRKTSDISPDDRHAYLNPDNSWEMADDDGVIAESWWFTYDAQNEFFNVETGEYSDSVSGKPVTVIVRIPTLNAAWKRLEREAKVTVRFTLEYTKDKGVSWNHYDIYSFNNYGNLRGTADEIKEITLADIGSINGVRIKLIPPWIGDANEPGAWVWDTYYEIYLDEVKYYKSVTTRRYLPRILYYDTMENKWSLWKNLYSICMATTRKSNEEKLELFGDYRTADIFEMNVGHSDNGGPIFFKIATGYTDGKMPEKKKRWVYSRMVMDISSDEVTYLGYVDRLEAVDRQLNVGRDPRKMSEFGDEFGGYYNVGEGQKEFKVVIGMAGYRYAEEMWTHGHDVVTVRSRTVDFIERE